MSMKIEIFRETLEEASIKAAIEILKADNNHLGHLITGRAKKKVKENKNNPLGFLYLDGFREGIAITLILIGSGKLDLKFIKKDKI